MYVDESGDSGLINSPTTHFALSGLVIHESQWRTFVDRMLVFRRALKAAHGLPIRMEIHAADFVKHAPIPRMERHVRIAILRNLLDELAKMPFVSITNVVIDKRGKPADCDVFDRAWRTLFQRFENTMTHGNFPGAHADNFGLVLTDATDGAKLRRIVRKMNVFNPVPNMNRAGFRNLPILRVIEDPHGKDSKDSFFIQACDTCAYFLTQQVRPNRYIKRAGAQNYIKRLMPVLNRLATAADPLGIVRQ